jgi:hypothetical protein
MIFLKGRRECISLKVNKLFPKGKLSRQRVKVKHLILSRPSQKHSVFEYKHEQSSCTASFKEKRHRYLTISCLTMCLCKYNSLFARINHINNMSWN